MRSSSNFRKCLNNYCCDVSISIHKNLSGAVMGVELWLLNYYIITF